MIHFMQASTHPAQAAHAGSLNCAQFAFTSSKTDELSGGAMMHSAQTGVVSFSAHILSHALVQAELEQTKFFRVLTNSR